LVSIQKQFQRGRFVHFEADLAVYADLALRPDADGRNIPSR